MDSSNEIRAVPISESDTPLLTYWRAIRKRLRLIGGLFVVTVLTTMAVSLLLPKVYESTATVLPPLEAGGGGGGLLGLLSGAGGGGSSSGAAAGAAQSLGLAFPSMPATPTDVFLAMLKSRVMADSIIEQLNLMQLWEAKGRQDARERLEEVSKISAGKDKVIKIVVESTNQAMAADIANAYVTNLDRLNRTLNVSKASQNRAFIERRLNEIRGKLAKAEEALKEFQTDNKTVLVEAQAFAMINAASVIQAQIAAQEVQLQVLSSYLGANNPQLAREQSNVDELRKQLYLLESGKGGKGMLPGERLHPAMVTVPTIALSYARLMREMKVQETLVAMLTSQYEQARLAEARDTPTVQVLDAAIPAERKIRPRISLNMLIAGALALIVGVLIALFMDYLERRRVARKLEVLSQPVTRVTRQASG